MPEGGASPGHWSLSSLPPQVVPGMCVCGGGSFCLLSSLAQLLAYLLSSYSSKKPVGATSVPFLLPSFSFSRVPQTWYPPTLAPPPTGYRPACMMSRGFMSGVTYLTSYVRSGRPLTCPGSAFLVCKVASVFMPGPLYKCTCARAHTYTPSPPTSSYAFHKVSPPRSSAQ